MPFFYDIDNTTPAGRRTAERLLVLREALAAAVPRRTFHDTLLLATWNICEFDSARYGDRMPEAMAYIAEIISHFDLVAVQEVREDLRGLDEIRRLLGRWWKYVVTDVTEGKPGNRERLAFLYDARKVRFSGVAGEVVIPPKEIKQGQKIIRYDPTDQLSRTPFVVGFSAGWFDFMLCTVHMVFGEQQADDPKRVKEIQLIADFLADRAGDGAAWSANLILLGDFNIFKREDETMQALTDAGFVIPDVLSDLPVTNVGMKGRHYDQIAFNVRETSLRALSAGVFDFYDHVYTRDDQAIYISDMGESYNTTSKDTPRSDANKPTYYKTYWRIHQMSDHLPMWVELKVDHGPEYLQQMTQPPT